MTQKDLFKDAIPIKEDKLNSQNTPREKDLYVYPGFKSTD